jgi:hypothetical protein
MHLQTAPKTPTMLRVERKKKYYTEYYEMKDPLERQKHIQDIEAKLKELIEDMQDRRWAFNNANRDLEDEMTPEERQLVKEKYSRKRGRPEVHGIFKNKPHKDKKQTFVQKSMGVSAKDLAMMSDDQQEAYFAKFMAAKKKKEENGQ